MLDWLTTVIPRQLCPYCLTPMDRATAGDPMEPRAVPKPGDVTVCLSCASPLMFDEKLRARIPRKGELVITPPLRRLMTIVRSTDRRGLR